jgi:hypothetical protein
MQFLPSELISSISDLLEGEDVVRLYQCGERRLNILMERSVKRFYVRYKNYTKVSWPASISRFSQLKHLEVKIVSNTRGIYIPKVDITSIPATVEYLNLSFVPSFNCLLKHCPSALDRYQGPPLASLLPNLKSLRYIKQYEPSKDGSFDNARQLFEALPPTIQSITGLPLILKCHELAILPRTLTDLCVNLSTLGPQMPHFPPHLVSLVLHLPKLSSVTATGVNVWDHLPYTLQTLSCMAEMPTDNMGRLPPELTYLSVGLPQLTLEFAQRLPRHMRDLNVRTREKHVTVEILQALPRTLKKFDWNLSRAHGWGETMVLEQLEEQLKALPTSLTEGPTLLVDCPPNFWKFLPPNLSLVPYRIGMDIAPLDTHSALLKDLPRSLTILDIAIFDADALQYLPASLTALSLQSTGDPLKLQSSSLHHLTRLSILELGHNMELDLDSLLDGNFPKLTEMSLSQTVAWNSLKFSNSWAQSLINLVIKVEFKSSPPRDKRSKQEERAAFLIQLSEGQGGAGVATLGADSAGEKLIVSSSSSWISSFPSALTSLTYSSETAPFPSSALRQLPRGMRELQITGFLVDGPIDDHFLHLPPLLTSIDISATTYAFQEPSQIIAFAEKTMDALPATLDNFDVGDLVDVTPLFAKRPYLSPSLNIKEQKDYAAKLLE